MSYDSTLTKRIKSFLWRAGAVALAAGISFLAGHLQEFAFPPAVTAVLGLVLGEITKYLNTQS